MTLFSDMEIFKWTALVEEKREYAKILPRPTRRILIKDPSQEFESEDASNAVHQLFGFLWDYPEVFDAFTNDFLVPYCQEQMQINHFKVDQILGLVVHRFFCDVTAEVSDWRVVTL